MRKLILAIILILFLIAGFFFIKNEPKGKVLKVSQTIVPTENISSLSPKEAYLFVPYWTLDSDLSINQNRLIYFGITGGREGIDTEEPGYKNLEKFMEYKNKEPSYLAVRMLETDSNFDILKDKVVQEKIIAETVRLAEANNFTGIILDFETQGLPFESLLKDITSINTLFKTRAHAKGLTFGTLLFGDTFYRVRPYDVEAIGKSADRVYIMAYDFSKSKGDPGPNFPLQEKEIYGYDFKTMAADFLKVVPRDKLTIIFGMFGYDWKIDEKGRGSGVAESKTTLQMERTLTRCISDNTCKEENANSLGTKIKYKDGSENHIVWFENSESVSEKIKYLYSIGLNSIGYWAYSFF